MTSSLSRRRLLQTLGITSLAGATGLGSRVLGADGPAGDAPVPAPHGAGYYRHPLGKYAVYVLSEGTLRLPSVHPVIGGAAATEAEVKEALEAVFLPTDHAITQLSPVLIDTGEARILVDVGYGDASSDTAGELIGNLAHAGFAPGDITHIVITHAHPDHMWGLVDGDNQPLFPYAEILLGKTEHAFWHRSASELEELKDDPKLGGIHGLMSRNSAIFDRVGDQLRAVDDDAEVYPGVKLLPMHGHTPGHTGLHLRSGDDALVLTADLANHEHLFFSHPEWAFGFDFDPAHAARTRREVLAKLAADGTEFLGYHFSFPNLGHVKKNGDAFRFYPSPWRWAV